MEKQLPNGWKSPKLDELIIFKLGGDWGKEPEFNDSDYVEVRCIRASELRNWSEEKGETAALRKIKKSSLAKRELQAGDILVEISGGGPEQPVGRTVLIDKSVLAKNAESKKVCTNFFRLIRPSCKVNAKYLNIFLQYFYASGKISEFQSGSNNLRNLKFNDYLQINVPLASEKEQESIVAKIEELFSELDSGIASLKTAQEQLKIYRQALLKHAFEGKLTEQWRKDNTDKLETPEQLLARIQTERETRYQQQLEEWKQEVKAWEENGKDGRKPRKPKITKLDSDMPLGDFVEIPNSWAWCQFGSLYEMISGFAFKKADYSNSGVRLFQIANVSFSKTLWDEVTYLPEIFTKKFPELVLEENDVVMALNRPMLGDRLKVTKLSKADTPSILYQRVGKFIFYNTDISSYFLYFLQSTQFTSKLKEELRGVNIPFINQTRLAKYYIPICSVSEQQEIVNQLEEKLSIIEQNEKEIESALAKAELLRQSILKKAFSGRLIYKE